MLCIIIFLIELKKRILVIEIYIGDVEINNILLLLFVCFLYDVKCWYV